MVRKFKRKLKPKFKTSHIGKIFYFKLRTIGIKKYKIQLLITDLSLIQIWLNFKPQTFTADCLCRPITLSYL
ncbi:MAG: hypothetical protein ACR2MT_01950, partial [Aurantibacter sp.]